MLKKLHGQNAELFKEWVHEQDHTILDIDGKRYLVKPLENVVQEEIESDPELKMWITQAKRDIANNEVYSADEVIAVLKKGKL